jgi:hypothetical protein
MNNRRHWQFSLYGLPLFATLVATIGALYAAFPRAIELAVIITILVAGTLLSATPQVVEKRPWIGFLLCFVVGTWLLLVGLFRQPDFLWLFALFAFVMYLFAAFLLVVWLRRSGAKDP